MGAIVEPGPEAVGGPLTDREIRQKLFCEIDLMEFVRSSWSIVVDNPYIESKHFDVMAKHFESLACEPIYSPRHDEPRVVVKRIVGNLPPSIGKSLLMNVFFPPWVWTWWPAARFLCFCYSDSLLQRDAKLCRTLHESAWYQRFWGDKSGPGNTSQTKNFDTKSGGWRMALPVAKGTGHHPDFKLTDDPQSREQAASVLERKKVAEWFFTTMPSRGKMRGAVDAVLQQRFDEDDLSGHIFAFNAANAEQEVVQHTHHIMLPMHFDSKRAMPDRGLGGDWRTQDGELLCPHILDEPGVRSLAAEINQLQANGADAQLEQNPKKLTGDIFKLNRLKLITRAEVPKLDRVVRYWDRAATPGGGCNTAGVLVGQRGAAIFFLDCDAGQWTPDDVYVRMESCAVADEAKYGGLEYVEIWIEEEQGSGGKESAIRAKQRMASHRVDTERPWTNKQARAQPLATAISVGEVYVVSDEPWFIQWYEELRKFPNGPWKDRVDASSGAYNKITGKLLKKGATLSSNKKKAVTLCKATLCGRPVEAGKEYCCPNCELIASFEDGSLCEEHCRECNQRNFEHQQRR